MRQRGSEVAPMIVLGIDLSLRSTGLVAVSSGFAASQDWTLVDHRLVETESLPQSASVSASVGRMVTVAEQILAFASRCHPDVMALEEQAFRQHGAHGRELGELTGVVKAKLITSSETLGLPFITVVASTARKTLLGKCPRTGAKEAVHALLERMGAPWVDRDRSDAFAIANHVLNTHGFPAVTVGI
jgi:Holliday junction resolvasome RuvABC endonuclease subunit